MSLQEKIKENDWQWWGDQRALSYSTFCLFSTARRGFIPSNSKASSLPICSKLDLLWKVLFRFRSDFFYTNLTKSTWNRPANATLFSTYHVTARRATPPHSNEMKNYWNVQESQLNFFSNVKTWKHKFLTVCNESEEWSAFGRRREQKFPQRTKQKANGKNQSGA